MIKRIFLFLLTNILVLFLINIILIIISTVLWINVSWFYSGWSVIWLLIFAWVIWFSWSFISLFLSKWMAKMSYKIELINESNLYNQNPKAKLVYNLVDRLSRENNIKLPEVWIYNSQEPNAFATWATKNSSLVAVSTWLLDLMTEDELEWVIAHEMAHVLNWDMVTMTLMQWVLNTFVVFLSRIVASLIDTALSSNEEGESNWPTFIYYIASIVLEIIFGLFATMLVMWFSRFREYKADAWSSKYVWKQKMIAALKKLQIYSNRLTTDDSDKFATMKIWSKKRKWFMWLFSSHPELDDRIKALENSLNY